MPKSIGHNSDIPGNIHCLSQIPTHLEAEAAISLTCFLKVNLEARLIRKIFNSETISTTEPLMTNQGTRAQPYENEI